MLCRSVVHQPGMKEVVNFHSKVFVGFTAFDFSTRMFRICLATEKIATVWRQFERGHAYYTSSKAHRNIRLSSFLLKAWRKL
jgi:hypothetical protein